jgi:hypothetical protein
MNKKLFVISGLVTMMLFTTITIPIAASSNDEDIIGRTRINAIGTFAHCDTDGIVYGHIFIGFIGIRPVFNLNIEICDDTISSIIMMNHFLHCVVRE